MKKLYLIGLILALHRELVYSLPGYKYLAGIGLYLLPRAVYMKIVRADAAAQFTYRY